ncbi:hypothetical protein [Streptomyces longwoodensis]|uniref:hypothetical protein n=1 Tax=Streptomyces longwoodensis TaxID=68231 RepID=UPI0034017755
MSARHEAHAALTRAGYGAEGADRLLSRVEAESAAHARRYRLAWRAAYQRAQGRGWAADRAGARARDMQEALQNMLFTVLAGQLGRKAAIDEAVASARTEILGTDLNASSLVLDAQAYRQLADEVLATMADPDRWDLDGDEASILAQYVKHIAALLTLASEFRVSLPDGVGGGYGEIVVQRESTGSDRWAVTDGARIGLQAWVDGEGWRYVTEIGRDAAFAYGLDEAHVVAEQVAQFEQERHDARIRSHLDGGESA